MTNKELSDFITPHPELSNKFPAIDGIVREEIRHGGGKYITPAKDAIRSDVLEIINMGAGFENWYAEREAVLVHEISKYVVIVDIPDLQYGPETAKYKMEANTRLKDHVETLNRALEYIRVIKTIRDERIHLKELEEEKQNDWE